VSEVMIGKAHVFISATGAGSFGAAGFERRFRDICASCYQPHQAGPHRGAGRQGCLSIRSTDGGPPPHGDDSEVRIAAGVPAQAMNWRRRDGASCRRIRLHLLDEVR
jgi:hypothetical protein